MNVSPYSQQQIQCSGYEIPDALSQDLEKKKEVSVIPFLDLN